MQTKINGIELHYEIDGTGPVCFVLHGGLGLDHTLYRRSLEPLTATLRLVFVDLRGNGRSACTDLETITMEQLADDVVRLADHLQLDDFLVLGHSYGGFVAQELALRHPERVRALMLLGTRGGALGSHEDPERHCVPARPAGLVELDALPLPDRDAAAEYWERSAPYFTNPEHIELLRDLMKNTIYEGPVRKRGSVVYNAGWSTIDRLSTLTMPTLLVVGSNDQVCPPADSRRIADQLPNGTLVEIEGANHWPWFETPEIFYDTVHHWLDENGIR